jgi:ABC-type transport system substrate-binding protein
MYGSKFGCHPVGTGPFMLHSWKPDVEMILTRNPQYFKTTQSGKRLPHLKTVRISFLRDPKNEFLEFLHGNLDVVTSIDGSFAPAVFTATGTLTPAYQHLRYSEAAGHSVEYYGMLLDTSLQASQSVPLAKQRLLRRALNFAIDRHRIVTYVLHGRGIPAHNGVLPPSMPGFSKEVHGYTYNLDSARALLAAAGYPNGKGVPTLLLQLGNSTRTASVAEAIQEQWKQIGINVELRLVGFPQHLSMVRAGHLALWRTSWLGDYPDPENFLALFVSDNITPKGPNTTRISRPDLDSLFQLAMMPSYSADQRYALYNSMERIVLDEAPWVFLYYDVVQRLSHPNVHHIMVDGSDRLILEHVQKSSRVFSQ